MNIEKNKFTDIKSNINKFYINYICINDALCNEKEMSYINAEIKHYDDKKYFYTDKNTITFSNFSALKKNELIIKYENELSINQINKHFNNNEIYIIGNWINNDIVLNIYENNKFVIYIKNFNIYIINLYKNNYMYVLNNNTYEKIFIYKLKKINDIYLGKIKYKITIIIDFI